MRVVAGAWRGRALQAPGGTTTRPTSDRARQALFDMLRHASWSDGFDNKRVLDGFAGTGALGLEALSRGAGHASFIEKDRAALGALRANIAACRADAHCQVIAGDVCRPPRGAACDLVFLDPPYARDLLAPALLALRMAGWIGTGTLIVAELGRSDATPPTGLLLEDRTHGAARLLIWRES